MRVCAIQIKKKKKNVCFLVYFQVRIAFRWICMMFQECHLTAVSLLYALSLVSQEIFTSGYSRATPHPAQTGKWVRKTHSKSRTEREGEKKKCIYRALRVSLDKQCACVLPSRYEGLCVVSAVHIAKLEDGEDGDYKAVAHHPLMCPPPQHPYTSSSRAPGHFRLYWAHLGWGHPCVCVCVMRTTCSLTLQRQS